MEDEVEVDEWGFMAMGYIPVISLSDVLIEVESG